ncbi:multidrug resistance protein [Actinobacillus equuli]|nr:multidrug resistance protein [Actinobacillus equuli]
MAASGFWFIFCVSLSIAAGLLIYQMHKIQQIPADELLSKLERIK